MWCAEVCVCVCVKVCEVCVCVRRCVRCVWCGEVCGVLGVGCRGGVRESGRLAGG